MSPSFSLFFSFLFHLNVMCVVSIFRCINIARRKSVSRKNHNKYEKKLCFVDRQPDNELVSKAK
jgi:hypothetical protein